MAKILVIWLQGELYFNWFTGEVITPESLYHFMRQGYKISIVHPCLN